MESYRYNRIVGLKTKERQESNVYYELYIDSLFLINFVMNLLLLELVNRTLLHTATRRRVIAGAVLGGILYLMPFFIRGPGWLKTILGFAISAVIMIVVTFRTKTLKTFWTAAQRLFLYSFLFGGILLFLLRCFPGLRIYLTNIFGILGVAALVFLEIGSLLKKKNAEKNLCHVVLMGKGAKITVNALVDSGNHLVEPISGKPVCILERQIFDQLWKDGKPGGYRAVPYHSIGKKNGILHAYLIPQLQIEYRGAVKQCSNVYVGLTDGEITCKDHYKMILHPRLLEEKPVKTPDAM